MEPTRHKSYIVASYSNRGVTFEKGEGMYLIDDNGDKYLDLGSNYGVNIFGFGPNNITKALEIQLHRLNNLHGSFNSSVRNEAAKMLVDQCSGKLARVFFSNSGSEAIEAALKFARLATKKSHFITLRGGYHGKTLGALSATSGDKYRVYFKPLIWKFSEIAVGDTEALMANVREDTAAIIIEPVQGEGGIVIPTTNFFRYIQRVCREKGILLLVDEIQTGGGRTGTFLAGEQFGLEPDILCLGKGIAGGIPIGVTVVTESIAEKIPLHVHTSTFGGHPLACAGIVAVLKEFNDGRVLNHIRNVGEYFLSQLQKIKSSQIVACRGKGLMLGIEVAGNATPILKALQQEKIIAIPAGSNVVRFLPPYIITKKEMDKAIEVLKKII